MSVTALAMRRSFTGFTGKLRSSVVLLLSQFNLSAVVGNELIYATLQKSVENRVTVFIVVHWVVGKS